MAREHTLDAVCEQARRELAALATERDRAVAERSALAAERDLLESERALRAAECEGIRSVRDELATGNEILLRHIAFMEGTRAWRTRSALLRLRRLVGV